jgi:hypothetical protein
MTQPPLYLIGTVFGEAGLNAAQLAEVKSRLKYIVKSGLPMEIRITVPRPHRHRTSIELAAAIKAFTDALPGALGQSVSVADVQQTLDCLKLFAEYDEVWCLPSDRQSQSTKSRAWVLYAAAKSHNLRAYKLIPPWIEPGGSETKIKPTKGRLSW